MTKHLRFNIANIPSSYRMDRDDATLPIRIDINISPTLRYTCRYWGGHLSLTSHDSKGNLPNFLKDFLQLGVLFWIEAICLLGQRGVCYGVLREAQKWLTGAQVSVVSQPLEHGD